MTAIQANGITIEYEEMGPPDAPVILLVMELCMQLIAWPKPFCEGLAARGFPVVRFDNRDAGLLVRSACPAARRSPRPSRVGAWPRPSCCSSATRSVSSARWSRANSTGLNVRSPSNTGGGTSRVVGTT